jgi:hypothetical protein
VNPPLLFNFRKPEPIFIKFGMYVIAPEPISTANYINPSHQSVCLNAYVATQRLGINVTAATNTHNRRIVGCIVFYAVRVVSKDSGWFILFLWLILRSFQLVKNTVPNGKMMINSKGFKRKWSWTNMAFDWRDWGIPGTSPRITFTYNCVAFKLILFSCHFREPG